MWHLHVALILICIILCNNIYIPQVPCNGLIHICFGFVLTFLQYKATSQAIMGVVYFINGSYVNVAV